MTTARWTRRQILEQWCCYQYAKYGDTFATSEEMDKYYRTPLVEEMLDHGQQLEAFNWFVEDHFYSFIALEVEEHN